MTLALEIRSDRYRATKRTCILYIRVRRFFSIHGESPNFEIGLPQNTRLRKKIKVLKSLNQGLLNFLELYSACAKKKLLHPNAHNVYCLKCIRKEEEKNSSQTGKK